MGNRKPPSPSQIDEEYEQWEMSIHVFAADAVQARDQPMTGADLRARIDALGVPYALIASWLGLTIDGLHKQLRGDRAVSPQTALLLGHIEHEARLIRVGIEDQHGEVDEQRWRRETRRYARAAAQRSTARHGAGKPLKRRRLNSGWKP